VVGPNCGTYEEFAAGTAAFVDGAAGTTAWGVEKEKEGGARVSVGAAGACAGVLPNEMPVEGTGALAGGAPGFWGAAFPKLNAAGNGPPPAGAGVADAGVLANEIAVAFGSSLDAAAEAGLEVEPAVVGVLAKEMDGIGGSADAWAGACPRVGASAGVPPNENAGFVGSLEAVGGESERLVALGAGATVPN
jgi:hypothetical protein